MLIKSIAQTGRDSQVQPVSSSIDQSTLNKTTNTLKEQSNRIESIAPQVQAIFDKIDDQDLGITFITQAIGKLGFSQVASIAQWAVSKVKQQGGHAGKLFVSVASKEMAKWIVL